MFSCISPTASRILSLKALMYGYDVWLWHWNKSPIISMEASRRAKTAKRLECRKLDHMWWVCSLFSWFTIAWCIMDSCHKIIRSIRNTTLKLCADCAKQRKHTELWGNKSWIFHHDNIPAHTSMFVHEVLAKNKISFILLPNKSDCVYAWTTWGNIATLLWKAW